MNVVPLFCPGRSARCVLFMLLWASSVLADNHHQRHACRAHQDLPCLHSPLLRGS